MHVLTGRTSSPNGIASPGCHQAVLGGSTDAFVVVFNSQGQRLWGTYYGGLQYDQADGCTFGSNHSVFVVGTTNSINNISTPFSYQPLNGGGSDAFLVKFDSAGTRLWGTFYGGTSYDVFTSCYYVKDDTLYLPGYTGSANNIASPGAFQEAPGGDRDDLLIKFLDCWQLAAAGPVSGSVIVCKPATDVNFSIPVLPHAVDYVWTLPPGAIISSGAGTASIFVNFALTASSGNIKVKGMNKCGVASDSALLYITVNPRPLPMISGPANTCAGPGKVYSTAAGQTNYQWSVSAGGVITSGSTTNTVTITWNTPGSQQVFVNYTDAGGCDAPTPSTFDVLVTVSPVVDVTITASSNNVCAGAQVTFTATPVNGGVNPSYLWLVNGSAAGTDSPVFSYSPLNNDLVSCVLTSSISACVMNNPANSQVITMVVNPGVPVSLTINASVNPVCSGTTVLYTAFPINGGSLPSYQWKVNGTPKGANLSTYSYIPLNGDVIICELTSNAICATGNPATSNTVAMTVDPGLPVSVSISPSANPVCSGTTVLYTAFPINGGSLPSYQWKVNGTPKGTNLSTYSYIPLNGDVIICELTSNAICATGNPATSNTVAMTVDPGLPVSVSISASSNPVCAATTVNYTAIPSNGGSTPVFQWTVNGANAGTNSSTYSYSPQPGDIIRCQLTSSLTCVTNNPTLSNQITMTSLPAPLVTFTSCFDPVTTINAHSFKLKGGLPLNGVYSGPGVNPAIGIFSPSAAGAGTKTITYTYTNSFLCSDSKTLDIVVMAAPSFTCGSILTDVRDNKIYPTIQIGSQCWMQTNLDYGNSIPGTTEQSDNCVNEKYCYADDPANCSLYGGLYQWDEIMAYINTSGSQGLCPPAWHLPSQSEWIMLFNSNQTQGLAGKFLQDTIIKGFRAIESGFVYSNIAWKFREFATFFWSSDQIGPIKALSHGMNLVNFGVSDYYSNRSNAFAVRCLKD